MTDIPSFPYSILWEERVVRPVANLTRRNGDEFLALAAKISVHTTTLTFPLADTNEALTRLRDGRIKAAVVRSRNKWRKPEIEGLGNGGARNEERCDICA